MSVEPEQTPEKPREADSGDTSGQGRPRRDDTEVFPQQRNQGQFGTHGGPDAGKGKHAKKDAD